jgi:hypothetical protein
MNSDFSPVNERFHWLRLVDTYGPKNCEGAIVRLYISIEQIFHSNILDLLPLFRKLDKKGAIRQVSQVMRNYTHPVGDASHLSRPCMKLVLRTIVVGCFIGLALVVVVDLSSLDSSFIRASSYEFKVQASNLGGVDSLHDPDSGEVDSHHEPDSEDAISQGRFSVSFERTLSERGVNLITAKSGCHLTAWVFHGGGSHASVVDCYPVPGDILDNEGGYHGSQHLDLETASQIQSYDTIYVNTHGLTDFVETILPNITSRVILLVGQHHRVVELIPAETEVKLLNSSMIVRVFSQNLGFHFREPRHPKLAPWPYGIQPSNWPLDFLRKAIWRLQDDANHTKTKGIMHGYLSMTNLKRESIPSGQKLDYTEYYDEIARHRYILSPDGDRPECYRTYEAIGLGTVPITELLADLHRHLQPAPVLFETSDWNITEAQAMERLGIMQFPTVNRMLVLEEYWLDYVQREVGGRNLRWFDCISLKKAKLHDFQILT